MNRQLQKYISELIRVNFLLNYIEKKHGYIATLSMYVSYIGGKKKTYSVIIVHSFKLSLLVPVPLTAYLFQDTGGLFRFWVFKKQYCFLQHLRIRNWKEKKNYLTFNENKWRRQYWTLNNAIAKLPFVEHAAVHSE